MMAADNETGPDLLRHSPAVRLNSGGTLIHQYALSLSLSFFLPPLDANRDIGVRLGVLGGSLVQPTARCSSVYAEAAANIVDET